MDAEEAYTEPHAIIETNTELKSEVLSIDIAKEYSFFKRDLVLGNINHREKQFVDAVFDLISDLLDFARAIEERQYIQLLEKYNTDPEYRSVVDTETEQQNQKARELRARLEADLVTADEYTRQQITERLATIQEITPQEYIRALAREESIRFFNHATEKLVIITYEKLNISRSLDGFQQKTIFEKAIRTIEEKREKTIYDRVREKWPSHR